MKNLLKASFLLFILISLVSPVETAAVTSTFYPSAGEVSPVDGWAQASGAPWNTVHDATAANTVNSTDTQNNVFSREVNASDFRIQRSFHFFDTSTIGSDTVDSATVSLYNEGTAAPDNDGRDFIRAIEGSANATSSILLADYDNCGALDNPIALAPDRDLSSGFTLNAYNDWAFYSTTTSAINTSGLTQVCFREGHDATDDEITSGWNFLIASSADNGGAGTTQDPMLVVEHSPAAADEPDSRGVTTFFW